MSSADYTNMTRLIDSICEQVREHNQFPQDAYERFDVKRGLRNADGTGVMAGITNIGNVRGYYIQDGDRMPMEGQLTYRGYDVAEMNADFQRTGRFGYEEVVYLLLFGTLPTREQLALFRSTVCELYELPRGYNERVIMSPPSRDIMNKLATSILNLYVYDASPEPSTLENELRQVLELVARTPVIVANCYNVKRHYFDNESLTLHRPNPELSIAENFLYSVRHDKSFTPEEAHLLDLCLVVHAEHGGGNNSVFACRTLTSSGTDIYSSIAAAVGALKGPRHGGASNKVTEMVHDIMEHVSDWNDDDEILAYLCKILCKEANDRSGLIYGMGHAIYTLSDPRATQLRSAAERVAEQKGMLEPLKLIHSIERLTPHACRQQRGMEKAMCANVDLYSGFIYSMMGIPQELHTPLFAVSRMAGWCAHRLEEAFYSGAKIIRPAYKSVAKPQKYRTLDERG